MSNSALDIPAPGGDERSAKSASAFKTISEVAHETGVPQHVLRFWEAKFNQLRPLKRGGGRRYYRPEDVVLLHRIRRLLHDEGYTIKGVQKVLRETPEAMQPRKPSLAAFPRTRKAVAEAAPSLLDTPGKRLVLDVELLNTPSGREKVLRDVIAQLKALRDSLGDE